MGVITPLIQESKECEIHTQSVVATRSIILTRTNVITKLTTMKRVISTRTG
jgi:hypothetical protein